jgi:maltose-binding protein MalE
LGLAWLELLAAFEQAGPVEQNSNRDLQLFKAGKAGIIVDGSWSIAALAQAIGAQNLAIDPWPTYRQGRLAGFVQADCLYLNFHAKGEEQAAALQFMGYFLAPEVQTLLAEGGLIPSGVGAQPRDALIQQAMAAFSGGTAYPPQPQASVYWNALEMAIYATFTNHISPTDALAQAYRDVLARLQPTP